MVFRVTAHRKMDITACDRRAWEAICRWPEEAGLAPDAPEALLSRWFLWDKVGRAIRAARDPQGAAFERELLMAPAAVLPLPEPNPAPARRRHRMRLLGERRLRRRRVLYAPFGGSRHTRILEPLLQSAREYVIVMPPVWAADCPGAIPWGGSAPDTARGMAEADAIHAAIGRGLQAQDVTLLEVDDQTLQAQLREQQRTWHRTNAELEALRPDALLLPADNHPPFIEYAWAARARSIPVIMLQHGLDCEHRYLDDAYATHIACWGTARAERYRRDSQWTPQMLSVVGNPHYDDARGANLPDADSRQWLWVTRPHRPGKCYAPSRQPGEGLAILDALLEGLRRAPDCRLWIKPHPFDYADCYRERLVASGANRACVEDDTVENLLTGAGIVISEDSTAGMDALRAGRVLVHAHLAASPPVVPFVEMGAALPGFAPEALAEAPRRAMALGPDERRRLREGREAILDAHAGPRDGQATRRFAGFVEDVLNRS